MMLKMDNIKLPTNTKFIFFKTNPEKSYLY
jgi:hypothetical protein